MVKSHNISQNNSVQVFIINIDMRLSIVFIIITTWIVVGCGAIQAGCFGHWVKGPGPQRGTRALNKDAHLPYYQCVDENNKGSNTEKRFYLK
jgi:hypothetical protein|tara:strand:- start:271 stop:546 length:276 start_codon:yes stop_codon:yes gene_type:complete